MKLCAHCSEPIPPKRRIYCSRGCCNAAGLLRWRRANLGKTAEYNRPYDRRYRDRLAIEAADMFNDIKEKTQ